MSEFRPTLGVGYIAAVLVRIVRLSFLRRPEPGCIASIDAAVREDFENGCGYEGPPPALLALIAANCPIEPRPCLALGNGAVALRPLHDGTACTEDF